MRRIFYLFAATVLLATIVSCKTEVTDVQLNKTELTLKIGETETLIATVLPKDADSKAVSWKSSSPETATVDNGKITAKDVGTAIITVTTADGNKTASCTVTVEENVEPIDEPEMIFVQGSNNSMGSFYIAKYPVTQKLWKQVMETLPDYSFSYGEGDNYPVYYVTYNYVYGFIKKLNLATGKNYRLAWSWEWEYAAKGGIYSKGYEYSGSNNIDEVAWYNGNSGGTAHPVGTKLPNELGIYDMSGNVFEWVGDYYDIYKAFEIRGGSWNAFTADCYVSSCSYMFEFAGAKDLGFRLAYSVSEPKSNKKK